MLSRVVSTPFRRMSRPAGILQSYSKNQFRFFAVTSRLGAVKPYLLADIGEGITECQIVSWAVKQGDSVQQFDPICEVQSDKASVEPLLDIDVAGDGEPDNTPPVPTPSNQNHDNDIDSTRPDPQREDQGLADKNSTQQTDSINTDFRQNQPRANYASVLTTPAVRRLLREYGLSISDVQGSGKDGRVLKHDVTRYVVELQAGQPQRNELSITSRNAPEADRILDLSPIQSHMFKSMTASLSVPHFLYSHTVDMTPLADVIKRYKEDKTLASRLTDETGTAVKLTFLPFILKALSQALNKHPVVNSLLDVGESSDGPPALLIKKSHNFGLAVDTPNGLLVPVLHGIQNHSVLAIASEASRLAHLAKAGKLSLGEMKGASLTVSNIGSIGGNVVAPVILSPMTAIVAVGKVEDVPAFEVNENGIDQVVKKKKAVLSWSADYRVLDGATIARWAQEVAMWLEKPELLGLALK